jgi:hypothetical protein
MSVNVLPLRQPATGLDLVDGTLLLFRVSLLRCLPLSMLAVLLGQLPALWMDRIGRAAPEVGRPLSWWALVALDGIVNVLLWNMLLLRQHGIAHGTARGFGADMAVALRRLPQVCGVVLLALLLVAAGFALLVLPGFYLLFALWFACPVQLFEGTTVPRSLDRSLQLVRGYWLRTAGLCSTGLIAAIVFYSISYVLGLLAAAFVGEARIVPYSTLVGALVGSLFMPFITALTIVQYADLTLRARSA